MQSILFDQVGADAGEIAFGQVAQLRKQEISDHQIENAIPQKLQALIVVGREAPVRDGTAKQRRVRELMLQADLQRG